MNLWVVVPAFNAARHLDAVIRRIDRANPPGLERIMVVDDGSTDDTAATARALLATTPRLRVIERGSNGGYGAAMKTGLRAARDGGAAAAASVHADGQYSPEVLGELMSALERGPLDLVQGSRIAGGQALSGGMPRYKYAGNWLLNKLERRVFNLPMTDFHSGYLLYGPRALTEVPVDRLSDSFDFDMEVIASARARGLAVGEAPIPTRYADEISHLNPVTYGLRVLRVMWRFKRGLYA
ncbi:MAG: glycosyltransferase family 2 protein [Myxococcales bacterium]